MNCEPPARMCVDDSEVALEGEPDQVELFNRREPFMIAEIMGGRDKPGHDDQKKAT